MKYKIINDSNGVFQRLIPSSISGIRIDQNLKDKLITGVSRINDDGSVDYRVWVDRDSNGYISSWGTSTDGNEWYPEKLITQVVPGYSKIIDGHVVTVMPNEESTGLDESRPSVEDLQAQLVKLQEQISALTK